MRITNKITLYLTYYYLSYIIIYKLEKATALANKDLNIHNLLKSLKKEPELVFSYIIKKITNKYSYIIQVGELVYQLYLILLKCKRGQGIGKQCVLKVINYFYLRERKP